MLARALRGRSFPVFNLPAPVICFSVWLAKDLDAMATALCEGSWHASPVLLLPCSHVLGAAGLGKQGGQGSEAGRHWGDLGAEVPRPGGGKGGWGSGREVPVAAVMERHGRAWKGHRTLLLTSPSCPRPAGIPRAPLPSPCSGKAAMIGMQLGWVSGLYVKASIQL